MQKAVAAIRTQVAILDFKNRGVEQRTKGVGHLHSRKGVSATSENPHQLDQDDVGHVQTLARGFGILNQTESGFGLLGVIRGEETNEGVGVETSHRV